MKKEHVIKVQNKKTVSLDRFIKSLKLFKKGLKEQGYNTKNLPVFIGDITDDFNVTDDFNKYKGMDLITMVKVNFKETKHIVVLKGV